ncbi:CapA family protein [Brevibacillus sp. M2.1A]|uniref:CapA family protein n=1 Tax=Brevibacillus TaxID=55080 RepID=UPI00156AA290|nr:MULTISPECIES: CapA family protein [Brevibacillus]MCC8437199.1 CapA family protein [Brevibacillus sp. M2.1A]MCE0449789.1 CapA family protein [Brevibacillus sp. AF8]UKK99350.1 CapA family protein [Brevibacillus brevis]
MKRTWKWALLLVIACTSLVGCAAPIAQADKTNQAPDVKVPDPETPQQTAPNHQETQPTTLPSRFPEQRISLLAVGDIMMHQEQLDAVWDPATKSYDFKRFFPNVIPMFREADWVIGNLETTMSGSEAKYSGYPMFNSPESLAHALKEIGFTAVTTANNHSMDRKEQGVLQTIKYLDEAGLPHTGTFANPEDRDEPLLLTKDGFTLALLSYTYGTNGIAIPEGKPYLINLISPGLMKKDIARAREKGADLVAVALHFGNEYQRMPSPEQIKTAEQALTFGADIILGAHPHVVQPYEWKTVTLEDGSQHKGLITYSLGNFISAQRWDYKDVGAILKLVLYKNESGEASIESAEMIPTYVHFYRKNNKRNYVIYPVSETLEKLKQGQKYPTLTKEAIQYMTQLQKEMPAHVNKVVSKKKAS